MKTYRKRGMTLIETIVSVSAALLLVAMALPAARSASCDDLKLISMDNLRVLAAAHDAYAADFNGRQFTVVRDDLGAYGGSCETYQASVGCHPPVILGTTCSGAAYGYYFGCGGTSGFCSNFIFARPFNFVGAVGAGSFQLINAAGFNQYVNGRFFDPVFYAPKDTALYGLVEPLFGQPCDMFTPPTSDRFSSYILSPAAMYHPIVFRPPSQGGWVNPNGVTRGYESPPVAAARFPSQKTRMIEHHWLQGPPSECNPYFVGCVPYFFNLGVHSNPVAMFYDGHVAQLSVMEAMLGDAEVRAGSPSGDGLWSRDTPLGPDGYYGQTSSDSLVRTSYHMFTTGGITGRDTLK